MNQLRTTVPKTNVVRAAVATALCVSALACERGGSPSVSAAPALDLSLLRMVDLTHTYNAQTIYWPNSPTTFALESQAKGPTPGGWFYSANRFSSPEHGGTHLDAPVHFSEQGKSSEQIPLSQLIAPAVVIDIQSKVAQAPDYLLTRDDEPGRTDRLHFPSYGAEAARLLVEERQVAVLGADVASIDGGQSQDFQVHRIAAAKNVPGLENLTNLDSLPPTGAFVLALPMKIEGGSGGPLRAVGLVPR